MMLIFHAIIHLLKEKLTHPIVLKYQHAIFEVLESLKEQKSHNRNLTDS